MLAGISTACFYPDLTERGLQAIAGLGAGAEIFLNAPSELEDNYLRELSHIAQDGGTRILSIHPYTSGLEPLLFFSDYYRRYLDGIEQYKRYFHAANLLGATILVLHGDRRETRQPHAFYFERFEGLREAGERMGITVAQENVPRCTSWCPAFFREMRETLSGARFVLDTKQCIRAGFSTDEMLDAMGDRVVHLHLSDRNDRCDCLPIGKGTLDLTALLQKMQGNGFDGGVMLELYRDSYGDFSDLQESYLHISEAIAAIQA